MYHFLLFACMPHHNTGCTLNNSSKKQLWIVSCFVVTCNNMFAQEACVDRLVLACIAFCLVLAVPAGFWKASPNSSICGLVFAFCALHAFVSSVLVGFSGFFVRTPVQGVGGVRRTADPRSAPILGKGGCLGPPIPYEPLGIFPRHCLLTVVLCLRASAVL